MPAIGVRDMAAGPAGGILDGLRRSLLRGGGAESDDRLLDAFARGRDGEAFAAILRRHGPMVLGVCRRVLRNGHDAEDAFQATFLVLARKAGAVGRPERLANWLYGVAHRTALAARASAARRRAKERAMARPEAWETSDAGRELWPVLDRELSRLPDKYRVPVVLCDLEGRTRKEAARQLGWPEGTVAGRLARARVLLAKRLTRHGLTLSGGALAAALAQGPASAAVPALLHAATAGRAAAFAAGRAAGVPAEVVALTKGVMKAMFISKSRQVLALLLAAGAVGLTLGAGYGGRAAEPAAPAPVPAETPRRAEDAAKGEPQLPAGLPPRQVLARVGADGKVFIKERVHYYVPEPTVEGTLVTRYKPVDEVVAREFSRDDIQAYDTKGKKVDPEALGKLLRKATPVLFAGSAAKVDPLHLRLYKDGTILLVPTKLPEVVPAAPPARALPPAPAVPVLPPAATGAVRRPAPALPAPAPAGPLPPPLPAPDTQDRPALPAAAPSSMPPPAPAVPAPPPLLEKRALRGKTVEEKLRLAFGNDAGALNAAIRVDHPNAGLLLAAESLAFAPDGKARFGVCRLALFGTGKDAGQDVTVYRGETLQITFKRPVHAMDDMTGNEVVGVQILGAGSVSLPKGQPPVLVGGR